NPDAHRCGSRHFGLRAPGGHGAVRLPVPLSRPGCGPWEIYATPRRTSDEGGAALRMSMIHRWNRAMAVFLPSELIPSLRRQFDPDLVIGMPMTGKLAANPGRLT